MPTFGNSLWGGSGGTIAAGAVGVPLSSIVMPAYRIAGITQRAMIVPSPDMFSEAIPELNRMIGSWNIDGWKIYTTSIADYPLVSGQKIYSIGPGGDIDADRPLFIAGANIMFPTSPVVRRPIQILDDDQWRSIAVQDIPGAPSYVLYYDGGYDENGRGNIYLYFQPPADYRLELYTWQALQNSFTSKDDVAYFPPGYEDALVHNLAHRLVKLNPHQCQLDGAQRQEVAAEAGKLLTKLQAYNARSPKIDTSMGVGDGDRGPGFGWLDGSIR